MNCTEYYTIIDTSYTNGFVILTTLVNTICLYLIGCSINGIRKDIKEQKLIKPPTYSSI